MSVHWHTENEQMGNLHNQRKFDLLYHILACIESLKSNVPIFCEMSWTLQACPNHALQLSGAHDNKHQRIRPIYLWDVPLWYKWSMKWYFSWVPIGAVLTKACDKPRNWPEIDISQKFDSWVQSCFWFVLEYECGAQQIELSHSPKWQSRIAPETKNSGSGILSE